MVGCHPPGIVRIGHFPRATRARGQSIAVGSRGEQIRGGGGGMGGMRGGSYYYYYYGFFPSYSVPKRPNPRFVPALPEEDEEEGAPPFPPPDGAIEEGTNGLIPSPRAGVRKV